MSQLFPELQKVLARNLLDKEVQKAFAFILRASVPDRVHATADQAVAGTTLADSTFLQFTSGLYPNGGKGVRGGQAYNLKGVLIVTTVATNGIKLDLDGGTAVFSDANINYTFTVAASVSSANTTAVATDASTTAQAVRVEIDGWLECSSAGSLILRFSETANSTGATVHEGSWLELQELTV